MARRGEEAKPAWRDVPPVVRDRTAALLGAGVARAERVYGGYAPSATFRLTLSDGRRAFFKSSYPLPPGSPVEFGVGREVRAYRGLGDTIAPWAPAYLGSFEAAGWEALLLEDVGPATVPPWTRSKAQAAMRAYGEFHAGTFGRPLPRWLPRATAWSRFGCTWSRLAAQRDGVPRLAGLAGDRGDEARAWLKRHLASLDAAGRSFARTRPPYALLHLDTRSDNVRVHPRASVPLRMFDWPFACGGPPELDFVAFAQSVACEGGPHPETLTRWYAGTQPVREHVLSTSAAAIAGFFAVNAWRLAPQGLPRLRHVQRRQLRASLAWAARLLDLPAPDWLDAVSA
ncbi:MAG TPA: hypothetical protein VFX49_01315 [Chloroflexota bacterium]|nr:hypothetical protein [Chloroflexota bacterium]